jgi:predicted Holliday junction resolvase-like endonuclease
MYFSKKFVKYLVFVLVAIILAMLVINYFNLNLNINESNANNELKRSAIFETMSSCNKKVEENMKNQEKKDMEKEVEEEQIDLL